MGALSRRIQRGISDRYHNARDDFSIAREKIKKGARNFLYESCGTQPKGQPLIDPDPDSGKTFEQRLDEAFNEPPNEGNSPNHNTLA